VPAPAVSQTMVYFLAQQNKADLAVLSGLLQARKVSDRTSNMWAHLTGI
jgi:hypothetical protein